MEPAEFGSYVRRLRVKQRLSLNAVGRAAGISGTYLCQIESGTRRPSAEKLRRLAPVLKVTTEELLRAVGYLEEPKVGAAEAERVEWAFRLATTDPESRFSAQVAGLLPSEVEVEIKKAIVIAYEMVSGKKLL